VSIRVFDFLVHRSAPVDVRCVDASNSADDVTRKSSFRLIAAVKRATLQGGPSTSFPFDMES
jgi:hypothetical protein